MTPIVERVVTQRERMLTVDEDADIGVRTREKQLPAMPLDDEVMRSIENLSPPHCSRRPKQSAFQ